jgi:hypothetical protein
MDAYKCDVALETPYHLARPQGEGIPYALYARFLIRAPDVSLE